MFQVSQRLVKAMARCSMVYFPFVGYSCLMMVPLPLPWNQASSCLFEDDVFLLDRILTQHHTQFERIH